MKTVLVVLTATLALGVGAADAGAKPPLLISNCLKAKFKPAKVTIACGDASLGARQMTWSKWAQKTALGTGTGLVNDCDPDCVHGTTRDAPMQLLLSHPRTCDNGQRLFTKLRYTWTSGSPVDPASGSGSSPVHVSDTSLSAE